MMRNRDLAEIRRILWDMKASIDALLEIVEPEDVDYEVSVGTMSTFGGPADMGVSEDEGLALCEPHEIDKFPEDLFLSEEEAEAPGLARRLNPAFEPGYLAMRWDYDVTSREWLQTHTVRVTNPLTGKTIYNVQPIDWGPNSSTGRIADLSPGLAQALDLVTDQECEVAVPVPVPMV